MIRTTDTKSRPQRENSYKLNLFITGTPIMTILFQHDFLFVVVTYQSVINCLLVQTITVSFVFNLFQILYRVLVFAALVTVLNYVTVRKLYYSLPYVLELYCLYCPSL